VTDNLSACPFCGGEQTFTAPNREFGDPTWAVGCKSCGAHVVRDLEAEAIAAWNRRSSDQAELRAKRADEIVQLARELVSPAGMVNRGVDRGLVVIEKADKSDPHYRLCKALEAYEAAPAEARSEQPVAKWASACCEGEHCFCGAPAARKVGEEFFHDDPTAYVEWNGKRVARRHPLTAYVCFPHFVEMMGTYALQVDATAALSLPTPPKAEADHG